MALFVKVEATPEHWYSRFEPGETVVPRGAFDDLRTRWVAISRIHEITALPDLDDNGTAIQRALMLVGSEFHVGLDEASMMRYIVHEESAANLVKRIEAAME